LESTNRIVQTADGSKTIFVPELEEHYHSVNGAIQESITVFIRPGIPTLEKNNISILEIGFGTGLNALLTAIEAKRLRKSIIYTGIEKYPVENSLWNKLEYDRQLEPGTGKLFDNIHNSIWEEEKAVTEHFNIIKHCTDIKLFSTDRMYDIIYFDAFARSKQPEMWTNEIISNVCNKGKEGALFLTYAATGELKRQLIACDYRVERLPGPTGKREITRAVKL